MIQNKENPLKSLRVEFHILQSFPVTCLNRDDVGAPKTAMIGGATRARVSSQCWKRAMRLTMRDLGTKIGIRTKLIHSLVTGACRELGATDERAEACGQKVAAVFIKEKKAPKGASETAGEPAAGKSDALIFISREEVRTLAEALKENDFSTEFTEAAGKGGKPKKVGIDKKITQLLGKPNFAVDGLDIALFGRMVAQAATLNVEAAASVAHAISTHRATNEVEFFTALDDCQEEPGSAHMGSLEFNAATYYRYVCLDLGQLWTNLAGQAIPEAVDAFVKALYLAVPAARQATQTGACPWEFAKVFVRRGQRLQVPFETAVRADNGGFLEPSKKTLCAYLAKKEKLAGSLFGKIAEFSFGEDENFTIDHLIASIQSAVQRGDHA